MSREVGKVERTDSWGEGYRFSLMDRFGMWLSTRKIRRLAKTFRGKAIGDIGCGFDAVFVRSVLDDVDSATLVDLSLADDLKRMPKVHAVEGLLPDALEEIPDRSLDIIVANNVLEHLWEPTNMLAHVRRIGKIGAACFFNVPNWNGKVVLETAAFRLGITSREEIDDHKDYFDERELWRLLIRSGFHPSEVHCGSHKFGLNTYALCTIQ